MSFLMAHVDTLSAAGSSSDGGAAGLAFGVLALIYLVVGVLFLVAYVRILQQAGYSGWYVLLGLIPLVNVVMFLVFAFQEWPVTREARGRLTVGYPSAYPKN